MNSKQELKTSISAFLQYTQQEDELKEKMKILKQKKEKLHGNIIQYMTDNDIADKDILFENKKISCSTVKTTESITKKFLLDKLFTFFKNKEMAEEVTEFIYNERNTTQKYALKIK
jgi:hypothetical protein